MRLSPHRTALERWLQRRTPVPGFRGLDIGSARHRGAPLGPGWLSLDITPTRDVVQGDLRFLPFRPGSFDALRCVATLHLVGELRESLCEFASVLRPGGRLFLTYLMAYEAGENESSVRPTPGAWRELLAAAGFKPLVIEPLDGALGVLAQVIYSAGYRSRFCRMLAAILVRWDRPGGQWTTGYGIVAERLSGSHT